MKGKTRINVGILINSIQNDYSTLLCKGAAIAAEELDVNLLIVPGRELNACWDNIEINRFEYQHNVLYSYVTSNNIDVLLVSIGTVGFFLDNDEIMQFLSQYSGIKVIVMESEIEGYPSIVFNLDGLREAIEHIIVCHNKKKIAFLSGPKDHLIADGRLQVYKKVLAEHNIEYCEEYVSYGDFTDYCYDSVNLLFDRNPDNMPEAICCANDSMVLAVKKCCEKRGLKIGRDILVTGYDDAAFANVMDPPLTTVKSYIMTMGYQAVEWAERYYRTGVMGREYVKTSLIIRQSCGCDSETVFAEETKGIHSGVPKDELIENIKQFTVRKSALDIIPQKQINDMKEFMGTIYDRLIVGNGFGPGETGTLVSSLVSQANVGFFTIDCLQTMLNLLKNVALENADDQKKIMVYMAFENIYKNVSLHYAEQAHDVEQQIISDRFVFSRIVDDMMATGKNEDKCFGLMIKDMDYMNLKSCFVYIYHNSFLVSDESTVSKNLSEWHRPHHVYLKAFSDNGRFCVPNARDQRMRFDSILTNKFISKPIRRTQVLLTLYFNEEQYGVMLIETDINRISETLNISKQVCTAIKLTKFMNQLEGALEKVKKTNEILSAESVSDQLTGLYNRRGFITKSEYNLRSSCMSHLGCAILFADLDCLKIINDTFGHKEGDFAIKKVAEALVSNLRTTDIVGRIGGDEFVAFIMDIDQRQMDIICRRIESFTEDFNQKSDKPYNVGVSMGVYLFDIYDKESIDQLMSKADKILYENKKNKVKRVIKNALT